MGMIICHTPRGNLPPELSSPTAANVHVRLVDCHRFVAGDVQVIRARLISIRPVLCESSSGFCGDTVRIAVAGQRRFAGVIRQLTATEVATTRADAYEENDSLETATVIHANIPQEHAIAPHSDTPRNAKGNSTRKCHACPKIECTRHQPSPHPPGHLSFRTTTRRPNFPGAPLRRPAIGAVTGG